MTRKLLQLVELFVRKIRVYPAFRYYASILYFQISSMDFATLLWTTLKVWKLTYKKGSNFVYLLTFSLFINGKTEKCFVFWNEYKINLSSVAISDNGAPSSNIWNWPFFHALCLDKEITINKQHSLISPTLNPPFSEQMIYKKHC